jgi:hypothetical protein
MLARHTTDRHQVGRDKPIMRRRSRFRQMPPRSFFSQGRIVVSWTTATSTRPTTCGVPKLHSAPWQVARAVAEQEGRPPKGAVWRALARAIPVRPPSWSGNARHKTPHRCALEIAFSTPVSPQFLNLRPEQWGRPQLPRRALQSWAASSLAGTDASTRNRSWPRIVSNGTDCRSVSPWWLTP